MKRRHIRSKQSLRASNQFNGQGIAASQERLEQRVLLSGATIDDCGCGGGAATPTIDKNGALVNQLTIPTTNSGKKTAVLAAKTQNAWRPMTSLPAARNGQQAYILPDAYTPFGIDAAALRTTLATAPREGTLAARNKPLILSIPNPTGGFARFKVFEWNIMEAPLAAQFPNIRAYRGQGIDDPAATAQIDFTEQGFHAQVLSPAGSFYVDPYYHLSQNAYISYFKKDLRPTGTFREEVPPGGIIEDDSIDHDDHSLQGGPDAISGATLRNYRLAIGATGEYVGYHGGTVPLGLSAVTTSANRLSGVYETDFACRFTLVAQQANFIFTNAATDPFTSPSNPSTSNTQNQAHLDNVVNLGSANYDFGHVYYRGSDNGLAGGIGNVCVTGQKAKGYSSHSNPINDPFNIDYVAHEMGHQFGGRHNFNNCSGSQGGENGSINPEVGSGNTIMSYAGICGSTNIQAHSDAYFNSINHDQIVAYTHIGSGNNVLDQTATGNNIPTVEAGNNYTIPSRTPFTLTAVGADGDPGDTLTYAWEQRNGGPVVALNTDNGTSPFMRPWAPTTSPTRTVPRLSNLLNNTFALGEILPTTTRSISMVVQVRDNRAGGGGSSTDSMSISVVNVGAAGFAVTAPNTNVNWAANSAQTVTWNVVGTDGGSINTANVRILLSTDGGNTFPHVVLSSTANDGSEAITVPNVAATTLARIKVEAIGNIYFDLSNTNFQISVPVNPNGVWDGSGDGVNWTDASNWSNDVVPTAADDVVINIGANPNIVLNGAQSVKSVNSSENLEINGSLDVAQASTFGASLSLNTGGSLGGAGAIAISGTMFMAGGSMTGSSATTISSGASMSVTGVGISRIDRPLTINGSGDIASGGNKMLVLGSLTLGAGSSLDLKDNDLIVNYSGGTVLPQIQSMINSARNGGLWNGAGLTTSLALAATNTTLGAIEGSDFGPNFGGEPLDGTAVLVKYTYYGDADFNGVVDFDDYNLTDGGFSNNRTGWLNGDFDGNGDVDFDDYALIDLAFLTQGAAL